MNIILLHGSSDLYGASKILINSVETFIDAGHSCIVVLPSEGVLAEHIKARGVQVRILNLAVLRKKYYTLPGFFNRILRFVRAQKKLTQFIQEEKIDLVFSNTTAVWVGAFVAKKMKIPHIWHVHEIIEKPTFLKTIIGNLLNRYASKVICVSNAVQNHWGPFVDVTKLVRIHNGININSQAAQKIISSKILHIGMAGRIHYWKGQLYFLSIAKELLKNYPDLTFHIAGDPFPGYESILDEMNDFIRANKLEKNIIYHGLVADMDSFYRKIDLLVLPSTQPDPFPTVILEAMSYALPIVATEHGGALEMIEENKTGIFIPWNSSEQAVEKIEKLLIRNNTVEMGKSGRDRLNNLFSLSSYKKNMLYVLEAL